MSFFSAILASYESNKDWVELIKDAFELVRDAALIVGAGSIVTYLGRKNFNAKAGEINSNLQSREKLESQLEEYVLEKIDNGVDIAIRFVHWKNYPGKLDNDGYKESLQIRRENKMTQPSGWIDSTGVNFHQPVSFYSNSIYVERDGYFFFGPKGQNFKGFVELRDKDMIIHMPFRNIINFDFKTRIEYEPVFYTRYHSQDWKKLYDSNYIVCEKHGGRFYRHTLDGTKQISGARSVKYLIWKFGASLRRRIFPKNGIGQGNEFPEAM